MSETKSKLTLTEEEMLDVMAYVDGELEGEAATRVEALFESSAEARELRTSFGELSERVRQIAETPVIDVTKKVMAQIAPNELDRARIKKESRSRIIVVGATLVALAAAVVLYVKHGDPAAVTVGTGTGTQVTTTTAPTETSSSAPIAALKGVQVDSVDTASATRPVSVFYVPNGDEPSESTSSVVVWIDDTASGGN
jgi:anti-sigma factor RsiW